MMGAKERHFAPLIEVSLEELVTIEVIGWNQV